MNLSKRTQVQVPTLLSNQFWDHGQVTKCLVLFMATAVFVSICLISAIKLLSERGGRILKKLSRIIIQSNNSSLRYIPERIESRNPNRYLCAHVQSSIIHNSRRMETIQMPPNRWMNKHNVVYTCNIILFSLKKEWNSGIAGPLFGHFVQHLFFHVTDDKKKQRFLARAIVGVEFVHSPYACLGFLPLPTAVHRRWIGLSTSSQSEWVWGCVCTSCDGRASCPGWVPPCTLNCQDRLWPPAPPKWIKQVWKDFSYLALLICLKCIYSSCLFQCLILEIFWVFIQKLGDVYVTRNMP